MRKSLRYFCALLCLFVSANAVFAQKFKPKYLRENDTAFLKMLRSTTDDGWIEFNYETYPLEVTAFASRFAKNLGINEGYELRLISDETDIFKIRHQHHQLYWKNILVEGSHLDLHSRDGILTLAHCRIIENLDLVIDQPIEEGKALAAALGELKLTKDLLKQVPKGQLVLINFDGDFSKENYQFAYTFDITASILADPYRVYVDATSGNILKRFSTVYNCFSPTNHSHIVKRQTALAKHKSQKSEGKGNLLKPMTTGTFTNMYPRGNPNPQSFEIEYGSDNFWHLTAASGQLDTRFDFNANLNWDDSPLNNSSSNWGTNRQTQTLAHWTTWNAYQYFKNNFNINGPFNNGYIARILLSNNTSVTAEWEPTVGFMRLSLSTQNLVAMSSVDIVAHEYGHGISQYLVGGWNQYSLESVTLSEGFSDIFGSTIERQLYPNGGGTNGQLYWQMGEDVYYERDMSDPHLKNDPRLYQEPGFWSGNPHKNAGVLNKWFYTLITGNGVSGAITPISSYDDAMHIIIYALDYYIYGDYNYPNAANALKVAAGNYFGECSPQQRAVINAWGQVGITLASCSSACDYTAINYTQSNVNCSQPLTLNVGCSGTGCSNLNNSFTGPNVPYNCCSTTYSVTTPSSPGYYTYTATLSKAGCYSTPLSFNVSVHCNGAREGALEFTSEKDKLFSVYPSPAQSVLNVYVNLKKAETIPIQIIDMQGKVHQKSSQKGTIGQNEWTLHIGQLPSGMYLIESQINQKREVRKFIKE